MRSSRQDDDGGTSNDVNRKRDERSDVVERWMMAKYNTQKDSSMIPEKSRKRNQQIQIKNECAEVCNDIRLNPSTCFPCLHDWLDFSATRTLIISCPCRLLGFPRMSSGTP